MKHSPQIIELPDRSSRIVGPLLAAALVILAVAVWQISAALGVGFVIISAGVAVRQVCEGVGYLLWRKRQGEAELARELAIGRAKMLVAREGRPMIVIDQDKGDSYGS